MPDSRRSRRVRVTAAALVAGALALAAGCSSGGGHPSARPSAPAKPSPSPSPAWNRSPASLAAVGDSITRGFDACSVLADCPEVSWATGSDTGVDSLAVRLLGPAAPTHSWNFAKSGARMSELPAQMGRAAAEHPGLVTVMTGANDACRDDVSAMTPVATFRTEFEQALRELRAGSPASQVYVASVPDLKRLWSTGRGSPLGKQIWKLGICQSMLADADDLGAAASARREAVYERVVAYNRVLAEVCAKDRACRYDGGAVFGYGFTGTQLSPWDWFHPSRDGQARLAEIAYQNITNPG
ncbi:SGNH/GDSL hydrolase family protein [Streptomyces sp. NBC_00083]|uniref:SGNH/GDSL hydrolase family protein n=1 Tax=Streptomyces sp. NBC_00083 TaxID=2975647 RepID=UPI00225B2291|nr:SGNH/GDSL hydrolase family protein [Streptomyces sp. NBC_00083]MCX5382660.1 SGNH/GDSL hydrolase family protein [Streptomyces sp. NBC_00083]